MPADKERIGMLDSAQELSKGCLGTSPIFSCYRFHALDRFAVCKDLIVLIRILKDGSIFRVI